jgi:Ca2+-binding RTX toxin-like protein
MASITDKNWDGWIDYRDGASDGYDYINGTHGNNVIFAYGGDDNIYAHGGDDVIKGGGGDDEITGGVGADYIFGDAGVDTASYLGSAGGVWVDLASGQGFFNEAQGDVLNGIENLKGSQYDDMLIGDDGANFLRGFNGNDILKGGGGDDYLRGDWGDDMLQGGAGADYLWGNFGSDTLYGGADDDILDGGDDGTDTMSGGTGNDIYYADAGDVLSEAAGEGYDVVYAYSSFTLTDNIEVLSLVDGVHGTGNAQANTIFGNQFDNILNGAGGSDVLSGLGGNDTFVLKAGEAHGDTVYEFNGNGAGVGDVLQFDGYGTIAQGATFRQLTATVWEIGSADGTVRDLITLVGSPTIDASDFVFV